MVKRRNRGFGGGSGTKFGDFSTEWIDIKVVVVDWWWSDYRIARHSSSRAQSQRTAMVSLYLGSNLTLTFQDNGQWQLNLENSKMRRQVKRFNLETV